MTCRNVSAALAALCVFLCISALALADEPIIVNDQLVFPPDAAIPRYLTETERRWLVTHPLVVPRAVTPPPVGPIRCVAEYEPMDGIVITWKSYTSILAAMGKEITTTGNADLYVTVDNSTVQGSATTSLTSAGANMSRVRFFTRTTDTVWVRDYGPRYIYEGNCRALVDHVYNRPRPNDDVMPQYFASFRHQPYYQHQLVHGGGNMHLNALNRSFVTQLVDNENPGLTETQIHDIWQTYQSIDTHFFTPFPTSIDSTQHIDMWMQIFDDNKVMISDWPNNVGSTQDIICDNAATYMAGQGFNVYRVPAFSVGGTHYTFTNVVVCNNLILLPSYTNATVSPSNATALSAWQAAAPGKTVVQVNCQAMVTAAGVMHCIVSHVPKHLGAETHGGVSPTAYLKNLRGGDSVPPSTPIDIQWISDDDVGVTNVDILLSTDGGAAYDIVIASATADDWSQSWSPPNVFAPHARVKIVARDGLGNIGSDESTSDFTINGAPVLGDMNCDARVTLGDVDQFVQALLDASAFTGCNIDFADMNGDANIDGLDAALFVDSLVP